jgi:hypothetical protein
LNIDLLQLLYGKAYCDDEKSTSAAKNMFLFDKHRATNVPKLEVECLDDCFGGMYLSDTNVIFLQCH